MEFGEAWWSFCLVYVIVKQTDRVVVAHEFRCSGKWQWNLRCLWGRIAAFRFAGHVLFQQRTTKTFTWSLHSITANENDGDRRRVVNQPSGELSS